MTNDAASILENSVDEAGLSARGWDRVRRVARTIADLAESTVVESPHVEEAVLLRGSKI
jgi:magnesium chelatase family protein